MHIPTNSLPDTIKLALRRVNYGANDIAIFVDDSISAISPGSQGSRGFVHIVNIVTGDEISYAGAWGGSTPFHPNPVDSDSKPRPLVPGFAVIKGTQGHPRTFASLYVHPENFAKFLPEARHVTARESEILTQYRSLTSAGRKYQWENYPKSRPSENEILELVSRGLLRRNKAGAISITTDGKNASIRKV